MDLERHGYLMHHPTIYALPIGKDQSFSATALWGQNKTKDHQRENAVLIEGNYRFKKSSYYSRFECVQKSAEELNVTQSVHRSDLFLIKAITLGVHYDVLDFKKIKTAVGGQVSVYFADSCLNAQYGRYPTSTQVFIRIYPTLFKEH